MPEGIIKSMRRGGVKNPYALLNAAGVKEGDTEETVKRKLAAHAQSAEARAAMRKKRKS